MLSVHFINLVSVIFWDYVYISGGVYSDVYIAGLDLQGLYIVMVLTCVMAKCLSYGIPPSKVLKASDSISDLGRQRVHFLSLLRMIDI